jgi:hypothetical protein
MTDTTNDTRMMDAFKRAQADIASLADWFECELDRTDSRAESGKIDWSDVAALNEVRRRLLETLAFFSGVEPAEIQRNLDELHM